MTGSIALKASAAQWRIAQELPTLLPDATVTLRVHTIAWKRDPSLPALVAHGVLACRKVGPFSLRREYEAPGE